MALSSVVAYHSVSEVLPHPDQFNETLVRMVRGRAGELPRSLGD